MNRFFFLACSFVGLTLTSAVPWAAAHAQSDPGIEITFEVTDAETGEPVSTAVVRHPEEAERHEVNRDTGTTKISVLYLTDGREVVFEKGDVLTFEVSAPGYMINKIQYAVKKRKNVVPVPLTKMNMADLMADEDDDPIIQFGRDKPID